MKHILNTEPEENMMSKNIENILSSVHKISECNIFGRESTTCCHKMSLNVGPQVRNFKYFHNNNVL